MWQTIFFYGFVAVMIFGFYQLCEKPHHKRMYKLAVVILILIDLASGNGSDCGLIGFFGLC